VPGRTVGRIQTRAAFDQLRRSPSRASSGPIRATFVPVDPGAPGLYPQVGYAIGKQCGNAVVRNTLRRRAREIARAQAGQLPPGTYLLRFAPNSTTLSSVDLSRCISHAMRRASS